MLMFFYCHRYIGIGIGLGMGGDGSRLVATTRARGMGYLGEETQPATWCLLTPPPKKNDMTTKFVVFSKKVDLGSSRLEQRMLSCVSSSGLFSCLNNECCYISHN